jgi:hypothetical protein
MSNTLMVNTSAGFYPGTRLKIKHGTNAGEILVVTKVEGNTLSVRKYNIFDKIYDVALQKWHGMQERFWTWHEAKFGEPEKDYGEELD